MNSAKCSEAQLAQHFPILNYPGMQQIENRFPRPDERSICGYNE